MGRGGVRSGQLGGRTRYLISPPAQRSCESSDDTHPGLPFLIQWPPPAGITEPLPTLDKHPFHPHYILHLHLRFHLQSP